MAEKLWWEKQMRMIQYNLQSKDAPLMDSIPFGLGGLNNGLAAYAAGNLRWWRAAITGFITFAIPMLLTTILFR